MMTSSNGNFFRVTGPLCGEFTGDRWIPRTKASDAEHWCFLLNKRLPKQSWGWWSETPSRPLWRHCNEPVEYIALLGSVLDHQQAQYCPESYFLFLVYLPFSDSISPLVDRIKSFMMTSWNGNIFRVTGYLCGRGIHRSPVNSPHKGQWRGALIFSLICAWINGWVNNGEAGDLRRHRAHYDVIVMHNGLIILGMDLASERRRYDLTSSLIGWAHDQNDTWN